jgi:hypothetical protein
MTEVPKTQSDLREMVYHTDARVTAMEGQLSAVATGQQRTESKLDHLIQTLSQPEHVNWAAWVGVGVSVIVLLVGGTIGFTNYIALTQDPMLNEISYIIEKLGELREFQRETHYEFGLIHEAKEFHGSEITKLWDHVHKQEDVDTSMADRLARAEELIRQNNDTDRWIVDQIDALRNAYNADHREVHN